MDLTLQQSFLQIRTASQVWRLLTVVRLLYNGCHIYDKHKLRRDDKGNILQRQAHKYIVGCKQTEDNAQEFD